MRGLRPRANIPRFTRLHTRTETPHPARIWRCEPPSPTRGEGKRRRGDALRLEKAVRRILRRALLGGGGFEPLDLGLQERYALGQFFDREQRQILANLVADLPSRAVVVLDRHRASP